MPPDQYTFQMATQYFQSAQLCCAAKTLLEAIESRGRMHSADQKLIILSQLYSTNLMKSHLQMFRLKVVPWGESRLLIMHFNYR
jgi:hypothetical protein